MRKKSKRTQGIEEAHSFSGISRVNPNAAGVDIGAVEIVACVIRMYLLGTWQTRILKVTRSPGTRLGCGRLGSPAAAMGQLIVHKSEPAALFGHPADTNLGLASDAKNPYR
jgi:hypothetical protein